LLLCKVEADQPEEVLAAKASWVAQVEILHSAAVLAAVLPVVLLGLPAYPTLVAAAVVVDLRRLVPPPLVRAVAQVAIFPQL